MDILYRHRLTVYTIIPEGLNFTSLTQPPTQKQQIKTYPIDLVGVVPDVDVRVLQCVIDIDAPTRVYD